MSSGETYPSSLSATRWIRAMCLKFGLARMRQAELGAIGPAPAFQVTRGASLRISAVIPASLIPKPTMAE